MNESMIDVRVDWVEVLRGSQNDLVSGMFRVVMADDSHGWKSVLRLPVNNPVSVERLQRAKTERTVLQVPRDFLRAIDEEKLRMLDVALGAALR